MKKSFKKYEKAGLPGGPNELKRFTNGFIVSERGQWDYPGQPTAVPTPSGRITMEGVEDDLVGIDNLGNTQYMTPDNEYQFEGDMVYEIPQAKKGGSKKPSKKYSRSLMAKNRLFAKNPLFKKPKSVKNKIFDPYSPYFQEGGEQDAMNAMMKARLAYANEFGNPSAQRMINIPDQPYEFDNGDTGTHYMASMDNYAVPQIQSVNGVLQIGDYGPESTEAMRFDSDEDANYFAENYKDVSPGFMDLELDDNEIEEYRKGGYIVEDISVPSLTRMDDGGSKPKKDKWGRPSDSKWYGFDPKTKKYTLGEFEGKTFKQREAAIVSKMRNSPKVKELNAFYSKPQSAQMIYPEVYAMGPGAGALGLAGRAAAKGISNLAKSSLVQGTKAALNVPIANIPGATIGNAISSGFAADAAVNRLPEIPSQIAKGDYLGALENTATGVLDLAGANMISPLAKGIGSGVNKLERFVKNARDMEKISKAYSPNLTKMGFSSSKPAVDFVGPMRAPAQSVSDLLTGLRKRGTQWDKAGAKGEELLHSDMINYHGTFSGRPIVEVRMPDGTPEFFYKSSGWAGKEGAGLKGTTEGQWQVFGGFSDLPNTKDWFIKDSGYKDYYGSNTFKGMAENLDNALTQKLGFQNTDELDNAINFQNRFGNVNSYTPIRKYGGKTAKYGYSVGNLIRKDDGGSVSGTQGLTDDFSQRLTQMILDARAQGVNLGVGSGYRSYEKQEKLWKQALKKYGSPEKARKWVAPPGGSFHNKGLAVDLNANGQFLGKDANSKATEWAHANAKKYGLHFRMGHEPWHIEPIEKTKSNSDKEDEHDHGDEGIVDRYGEQPDVTTKEELELIQKNKDLEFKQKQAELAEQERQLHDDDYSNWEPSKDDFVDPSKQMLEEYSKIIAPSNQNMYALYNANLQGKMKDGGFIMELTDKEIEKYRKGGFIIEELD